MSVADPSMTLEIGDRCQVKWRDGTEKLWAEIVECRVKRKTSEVEYYVHYENHDRRLDEWISLDKFLLETYEKKTKETVNPTKRHLEIPR
jgi:histone acetyltransferase MYST1